MVSLKSLGLIRLEPIICVIRIIVLRVGHPWQSLRNKGFIGKVFEVKGLLLSVRRCGAVGWKNTGVSGGLKCQVLLAGFLSKRLGFGWL